jgi:hypothetical protein
VVSGATSDSVTSMVPCPTMSRLRPPAGREEEQEDERTAHGQLRGRGEGGEREVGVCAANPRIASSGEAAAPAREQDAGDGARRAGTPAG